MPALVASAVVRRSSALAIAVAAVGLTTGCGSSKNAAPATTQATLPKPTKTITLSTTAATTRTQPTTTTATDTEPPIATTLPPQPPLTTTAVTTTRPPLSKAPKPVQEALCPSEQQPGITANFGHSRTRAGANAILRRARGFGFLHLVVERRACASFVVALRGLKNLAQGHELETEAGTVYLHVTLECRSHRVEGGLAAVFGHRRTRGAAIRLQRDAAAVGFQGLRVQQDKCGDWEVDLYGLKTPAQRRDFVREARGAGFRVRFEPG
jgi:hypothetical protein